MALPKNSYLGSTCCLKFGLWAPTNHYGTSQNPGLIWIIKVFHGDLHRLGTAARKQQLTWNVILTTPSGSGPGELNVAKAWGEGAAFCIPYDLVPPVKALLRHI